MRYSKSWTEAVQEVREQVGVRKVDFVDGITPDLQEAKPEFEVKYASSKKGPIKVSKFMSLEDAKKFLAQVKKEGMNGIISKGGKPVKEALDDEDKPVVKKVVKMLKKASQAHAGQADDLEKSMKESMALQMKMAADDIETYAKKHGGIDKKDMMKAAAMLKKGDKAGAMKFIKTLDTDPRDYLLKTMGEEVEIDEKKSDYEDQIKAFLAKGGKIQKGDRPDQKKIDKVTKGFLKKYGVMKKKEADLDAKDKEELEKMMGEDKKYHYYNLDRGVYRLQKDNNGKIIGKMHDRQKEMKAGFPNADEVLSNTKQAAAKVAKLNEHCGECGAMDHVDENLNEADYELYHKTFSGAMQHAYAHAKKRGFIVDPDEIDNKVATGPKKPSSGKTNKYILGTNKKQKLHVQVANLDNKRYELNMYIEETEKENMNIEETIKQVVEGRTKKEDASNDKSDDGDGMDKVDPKAVKKKFKDRKDKDIDNDGDTDSTDKYLHKRRKAISKAVDQEDDEEQKEDHTPAQDTVKGKGSSKDKKPMAKYEETDSPLYAQVKKLLRNK